MIFKPILSINWERHHGGKKGVFEPDFKRWEGFKQRRKDVQWLKKKNKHPMSS